MFFPLSCIFRKSLHFWATLQNLSRMTSLFHITALRKPCDFFFLPLKLNNLFKSPFNYLIMHHCKAENSLWSVPRGKLMFWRCVVFTGQGGQWSVFVMWQRFFDLTTHEKFKLVKGRGCWYSVFLFLSTNPMKRPNPVWKRSSGDFWTEKQNWNARGENKETRVQSSRKHLQLNSPFFCFPAFLFSCSRPWFVLRSSRTSLDVFLCLMCFLLCHFLVSCYRCYQCIISFLSSDWLLSARRCWFVSLYRLL